MDGSGPTTVAERIFAALVSVVGDGAGVLLGGEVGRAGLSESPVHAEPIRTATIANDAVRLIGFTRPLRVMRVTASPS